jgi:serine/threonine protein kinase
MVLGAPERFRAGRSAVSRQIDIWSLGCVFSLAATWVTQGYEGIQQFNKIRITAIEKLTNNQKHHQSVASEHRVSLPLVDCFHDGSDVLEVVPQWHCYLRNTLRKSDNVTPLVLDLVEKKMLLRDPLLRLNASQVCRELENILENDRIQPDRDIPQQIMEGLLRMDKDTPSLPRDHRLTDEKVADAHTISRSVSPPTIPTVRRTPESSQFLTEGELTQQKLKIPPSSIRQSDNINRPGTREPGSLFTTYHPIPLQFDGYAPVPKPPVPSHEQSFGQPALANVPSSLPVRPHWLPKNKFYQNVFQAREEIENRQKGFFLKSTRKDEVLSKYIVNRDIVGLLMVATLSNSADNL